MSAYFDVDLIELMIWERLESLLQYLLSNFWRGSARWDIPAHWVRTLICMLNYLREDLIFSVWSVNLVSLVDVKVCFMIDSGLINFIALKSSQEVFWDDSWKGLNLQDIRTLQMMPEELPSNWYWRLEASNF